MNIKFAPRGINTFLILTVLNPYKISKHIFLFFCRTVIQSVIQPRFSKVDEKVNKDLISRSTEEFH